MKSKTILFVSKGEDSPSTRYRALAYFDALRNSGWHPSHATARNNPLWLLELLRRVAVSDVVVILRKTFSVPFLRMIHLFSKRLVFDVDDAIFYRSNGKPSRTRHKRFAQVARRCDQVWAGNEYLADTVRRFNSEVATLPTSLVPEKYANRLRKPNEHIDLVWIGSRSTRKYLVSGYPALERLTGILPQLRLKIVADFDLPSQRLPTIAIPWEERTEADELSSSHIGIAPMPDDPWTRGKCGLKVLQYMAAGLPVVSSPVGINAEIIEEGVTGFLTGTPEAFQEAIVKLAHNPDLRLVMGEQGRRRVEESYSVEVTYHKMAKALENLYYPKDLP